ncbi:MAG: ATP-binding protein [Patescibacteria group bacterium]
MFLGERHIRMDREGRILPRMGKSLFVRLFFSLLSLAFIPMILIGLFAWTTFQALISASGGVSVSTELSTNLIAQGIYIFLYILLMALFLAYVMSRSITQSLRTLTGAVEQITTGDLDLSFRITRKDEIGILGQFFNDMIRKLKEVTERQQSISKVKSEFISITAHQLRTPLSAMKWALHLLEEGDLGKMNKKQEEIVRRTYEENERMIQLVNDLLNVARIEEGRFGYNFSALNINELVSSTVKEHELMASQKNIALSLSLPPEPYTIFADRERLNLALTNLIRNALNYSVKGMQVSVVMQKLKEDYIQVSVADQGLGIADEDKERIFSKFFRGANVVKQETAGSGLGLFITRNIVAQHGGSIWFESALGKGTTFFFTLPLAKRLVPPSEHAPVETAGI